MEQQTMSIQVKRCLFRANGRGAPAGEEGRRVLQKNDEGAGGTSETQENSFLSRSARADDDERPWSRRARKSVQSYISASLEPERDVSRSVGPARGSSSSRIIRSRRGE